MEIIMKNKLTLTLVFAVILLTVGCNKAAESTSEIATVSTTTTSDIPVAAPFQSKSN